MRELQRRAALQAFASLTASRVFADDTTIKVGSYILGEFGYLVPEELSPSRQLKAVTLHFPIASAAARAIVVTAVGKMYNANEEIRDEALQFFTENSMDADLDTQQRVSELMIMLRVEETEGTKGQEFVERSMSLMPPYPDVTMGLNPLVRRSKELNETRAVPREKLEEVAATPGSLLRPSTGREESTATIPDPGMLFHSSKPRGEERGGGVPRGRSSSSSDDSDDSSSNSSSSSSGSSGAEDGGDGDNKRGGGRGVGAHVRGGGDRGDGSRTDGTEGGEGHTVAETGDDSSEDEEGKTDGDDSESSSEHSSDGDDGGAASPSGGDSLLLPQAAPGDAVGLWENVCVHNEGCLYSSKVMSVNVQHRYRGGLGRIKLNIEGHHPDTTLEIRGIRVAPPANAVRALRVEQEPVPTPSVFIKGVQTLCHRIEVCALTPFLSPPQLTIAVVAHRAGQVKTVTVTLLLPFHLFNFVTAGRGPGFQIDPPTFQRMWAGLSLSAVSASPPSYTQQQFNAPPGAVVVGPPRRSLTTKQLKALLDKGFHLQTLEVLSSICGLGNFHTITEGEVQESMLLSSPGLPTPRAEQLLLLLVKLDVTRDSGALRIEVRSSNPFASSAAAQLLGSYLVTGHNEVVAAASAPRLPTSPLTPATSLGGVQALPRW
eukprot:GHVU01038933.1.p1 GENE.GHVU01038933.1~~GHVU01038933.1.p1  ORF type:complete len:658 (+),score=136.31 GHVU01038933.1:1295-3268(+)